MPAHWNWKAFELRRSPTARRDRKTLPHTTRHLPDQAPAAALPLPARESPRDGRSPALEAPAQAIFHAQQRQRLRAKFSLARSPQPQAPWHSPRGGSPSGKQAPLPAMAVVETLEPGTLALDRTGQLLSPSAATEPHPTLGAIPGPAPHGLHNPRPLEPRAASPAARDRQMRQRVAGRSDGCPRSPQLHSTRHLSPAPRATDCSSPPPPVRRMNP